MTARTDFTTEEWNAVRDAPHLVALAVAMSGASGLVGTLKEAFSSSAALVEGMKSDSALLRSLCTREEISAAQQGLRAQLQQVAQGGDFGAAKERVAQQAQDAVRSAVEIVGRKGTAADVAAYRSFLKGLGERVANAAREGGFLGFGGERVSEGEKQMLARLETALGGVA